MKTCPHEKRLTACLLGDLPPAEAAALRAHLDACPACRASAAALAPLLDTLRDALGQDAAAPLALDPARLAAVLATPPRRKRRVRFYLISPLIGLAATGVIVLGAALLFPGFERLGGSAETSVKSSEACFETVGGDCAPGWYQEAPADALYTACAPSTAREAAGPPVPATGLPLTDGRDGGRAVRRSLSENAKAKRTEVDGDGMAETWALAAAEKEDRSGTHLSGAAAPAEPQPAGTPRRERLAIAESRITSDSEAEALSRSPEIIGGVVCCPTPAMPEPKTAQPQAFNTVLSVKSPVIMNGVGSARRREGARGQLIKEGKRETGEGRPHGSETFDADDIPVVFLDTDGNMTADSPALPADAGGGEGTRRPTSPAAEMGRAGTPLPAERPQSSELAKGLDTAGGKDRADKTDSQLMEKLEIVERDGALVLEALPPPADTDVRPVPPPPPLFNPFVKTADQPLSTFAIDVDTASYTLARQSLLNGSLPDPGHIRTEEVVNAFDYGDRAPDHATFRIFVEGAPAPFGRGTSLVRLGVKGRRLGREEARPAVLTFVVDASGSMGQPDRIGLARQALAELLGNLGPEDRVQLIAFNDDARVLADPAPPAERQALLAAFDRLQCTGSTHLEAGLRLAYARATAAFRPGAENRVILLSDGVANLGSGSADDILGHVDAARRQGITLSVFGVGRGAYSDAMLERLANKGDGAYRFLDSAEEVRRVFVDDLAATLYTIASDVKIQVEWFPAAVSRYRQIGYENRALTAEQFRDDAVDAGEVGSGQAVTALYEIDRAALPARAAADAPLGVVRVRYRPAAGGTVDEISRPIVPADLAPSFQAARPAFRVAACAAAFAESLRRSPHAAGYTFTDVADTLRPAALEFPLDTRIAELLRLVEAADRLSK